MKLKTHFYTEVRARLAEAMQPGSLLILAGNTEMERTQDTPYPFRQSNNFLYLTGINEPDAYLTIRKDKDEKVHEILFMKQLHPFMEVWEGRANQPDALRKSSGIKEVQEYKDREALLKEILADWDGLVYLDMPNAESAQLMAWTTWLLIQDMKTGLDLTAINPLIEPLRMVKQPQELQLMEEAIRATDKALQSTAKLLVPGVSEREVAAEFVRAGSAMGLEQSWEPIVSFGHNACVVHHKPDDTQLTTGDLVLFDVGLEVEGYSSDISRMVTVGKISARQQEVLDAVRAVQQKAIKLMKPGITFQKFEEQAAELMVEKLVELKLFASVEAANAVEGDIKWPAYRRYFSHYTSHYLGLDAHDVGDREAELVPGMVLTCEPGIYIVEEGIGVRIEDDILITEDGNRNLSASVVVDNR